MGEKEGWRTGERERARGWRQSASAGVLRQCSKGTSNACNIHRGTVRAWRVYLRMLFLSCLTSQQHAEFISETNMLRQLYVLPCGDAVNGNDDRTERRNSRFVQSPHCAANCLHHDRSSGPGTIVCKSFVTHRALIMYNMSCATWYEGTPQLLTFDRV